MSQSEWHRFMTRLEGVSAVCFDAFGTLVEIRDRRSAFRPLLGALPDRNRAEFKHRIMREDRELSGWPVALGVPVNREVLDEVAVRVRGEVSSVCVRPGVSDMLTTLRGRDIPIAVCSNLASPYAPCLRRLLSGNIDHFVLSCEVGAMKPDTAIYERVETQFGVDRKRILFVGDATKADIEGPRSYGFRSTHIDELLG